MYPHTRTIKSLEEAYRSYRAKQQAILVERNDKQAVAKIGDETFVYSFMDATWMVTETREPEYDSPYVSPEVQQRLDMLLRY